MQEPKSNFIARDLEDFLKKAKAEVLLKSIEVFPKSGSTVFPVKCPAVGRHDDYLKTEGGEPACAFGGDLCKYLEGAVFTLDDYTKKIDCTAI